MGKGERGKAEKSRKIYGAPAADSSRNLARQSGNIYYGAPSEQKERLGITGPKTAQSRKGAPQPQQRQSQDQSQEGNPVNFDRVYEVYRWWADEAGGDPSRLREHPHMMGDGEWALLDQIVGQHGTNFQGARDYREAQKSGASQQDLEQWNPGNMGLQGWSGTAKDNVQAGHAGTPGGGVGPGQSGQGIAGGTLGDYGNIGSQFQEFANTGGYTPEDIAAIRSRAVSPIRSAYSSARRDVNRQRSLQGGYSPNMTASLAKMAREQSYATADASTNTEAALAQMVNQGQRYGVSGQAGLYGTTPGLANTFGNQALQAQGLQNQTARDMTQAQIAASQLPGAYETTMGRIGQIGGAVGVGLGG